MGSYDLTRYELARREIQAHFEVALSYDDLDVLAKALWDLAALHSAYPRPHLERLHALRRYLLSVQIARDGGQTWEAALPAPPSESP